MRAEHAIAQLHWRVIRRARRAWRRQWMRGVRAREAYHDAAVHHPLSYLRRWARRHLLAAETAERALVAVHRAALRRLRARALLLHAGRTRAARGARAADTWCRRRLLAVWVRRHREDAIIDARWRAAISVRRVAASIAVREWQRTASALGAARTRLTSGLSALTQASLRSGWQWWARVAASTAAKARFKLRASALLHSIAHHAAASALRARFSTWRAFAVAVPRQRMYRCELDRIGATAAKSLAAGRWLARWRRHAWKRVRKQRLRAAWSAKVHAQVKELWSARETKHALYLAARI